MNLDTQPCHLVFIYFYPLPKKQETTNIIFASLIFVTKNILKITLDILGDLTIHERNTRSATSARLTAFMERFTDSQWVSVWIRLRFLLAVTSEGRSAEVAIYKLTPCFIKKSVLSPCINSIFTHTTCSVNWRNLVYVSLDIHWIPPKVRCFFPVCLGNPVIPSTYSHVYSIA